MCDNIDFQIASDLHIEAYTDGELPVLVPSAPYLILAGDNGYPFEESYERFIRWTSENYKFVFLLSGNNDYHQDPERIFIPKTMQEVNAQIEKVTSQFQNVIYMNRTSILIEEKVLLLGCILWTYIPNESYDTCVRGLNDYKLIFVNDGHCIRRNTPHDTNWRHMIDREWLKTQIENAKYPTMVVTHHAPSKEMVCSKFKKDSSGLGCAFVANTEELIKNKVVCWVSGHTHHSTEKYINGALCVANCAGPKYRKNKNTKAFDNSKTIQFKRSSIDLHNHAVA